MSTGNHHLTIRDYFDQVLYKGQSTRRAPRTEFSQSSANTAFHRLLTSLGDQHTENRSRKPTGLSVKDYLRHPVRVKCHSNYKLSSPASEKKTEAAKDVPSAPAAAANTDPEEKTIHEPSQNKVSLPEMIAAAAAPARSDLILELEIEKNIHAAAQKYDLTPELIRGVIRAESNFEVRAVSHAGARGLMQLMPETARELGVENPFDIQQNIDGGARYLRKMVDKFNGNIKLALAAYNAGPGAVERHGGQIPPYRETEQYVSKVLKFAGQMS